MYRIGLFIDPALEQQEFFWHQNVQKIPLITYPKSAKTSRAEIPFPRKRGPQI